MAEQYLTRILDTLGPEIDAGTPMVVLEPSCCSVFRDELTGLFPELPRAQKLKQQTVTLSEFLQKRPSFDPPAFRKKALVHGHCHHKAIMRLKEEETLFKRMGLQYELPNSGCCGMAGSFGFESDKYGVSVAAGERVLLPAVRRATPETIIVADGFSCKEQIAQLTDRHALHTAEVLALAMENPNGAVKELPEQRFVAPRLKAQKKSMLRAALITAGAIAAISTLALIGATGKSKLLPARR
jgi:Fe-S oxidoreductase